MTDPTSSAAEPLGSRLAIETLLSDRSSRFVNLPPGGTDREIEEDLKDQMAHDEARRCLRCDVGIGCGACRQVCPTGAIPLEDRGGVRRTIMTGSVVKEQPLLTCAECGVPTQTPAHRDFVRKRHPNHIAAQLDRERCPSCARIRADRLAVGVNAHA